MSEKFRTGGEFKRISPLWTEWDDDQPLAEFSSLMGTPEWLYIKAENAAICVNQARALRDWLNRALPEEKT